VLLASCGVIATTTTVSARITSTEYNDGWNVSIVRLYAPPLTHRFAGARLYTGCGATIAAPVHRAERLSASRLSRRSAWVFK
jgi:hypothetical protein